MDRWKEIAISTFILPVFSDSILNPVLITKVSFVQKKEVRKAFDYMLCFSIS